MCSLSEANFFTTLVTCRIMATRAEYAGEYCKNLGLTIDEFYRASTHPPTMKIANIKKGPIYELSQI